MRRVSSHIKIGDFVFDHIVNADVNESIDTLTDTCTITIERKVKWEGKSIALGDDPILKRKDKVIVKAGYNEVLKTVFIGYVKNIKSGTPVTIECEDSMMLLKLAKSFTHTFPAATTLKQFLEFIIPVGIKFIIPRDNPITVGAIRLNNTTPAQALEFLKSNYGLFSYFRIINDEPVLYCGLAYWMDRQTQTLEFENNIIENDLVYKRSEDVLLKVKAIGMSVTGTQKVEVEVGDPEGEVRTVHHVGLDKKQLTVLAENDLKRFKYTGYAGTITTFGEPLLRKGDIANIVGNKYHEDGNYFVRSIKKSVGVNGYRQVIEIKEIANDKTASVAVA
jgi:hypothetical protein